MHHYIFLAFQFSTLIPTAGVLTHNTPAAFNINTDRRCIDTQYIHRRDGRGIMSSKDIKRTVDK
jgi:hypothetical protein